MISPSDRRNRSALMPILDPRSGDLEDDRSATKQRSLLSIAGSLFAEISLPKLVFAWSVSILTPAVLLGFAPLALTIWIASTTSRVAEATGVGLVATVIVILLVSWFGGRPFQRIAERNFWALHALAVQPGYLLGRETLRHVLERVTGAGKSADLARIRTASCLAAGVLLIVVAGMVAIAVWPFTQWIGSVRDLFSPGRLIWIATANSVTVMSGYLVVASLIWAIADATTAHLRDQSCFDEAPPGAIVWRVAHLSDLHVIGGRYEFRIESGRGGPRGNERLISALDRLSAEHESAPLDFIVVSGDVTDAGTSSEWSAFLDIMVDYPQLAGCMLIVPGNHDLNIVDKANPARLNMPFSPIKTVRKMRALSALSAIQGARVRIADGKTAVLGPSLAEFLEARSSEIVALADHGGFRRSAELLKIWDEVYPMIVPPAAPGGLGIALLNSNADTNFSFTNALGLISSEQLRRLIAAFDSFPQARWIVSLHHHLIEYPMPVKALSERIATALINGGWFLRAMKPYAHRIVVMHGHRHTDWIGTCGALKIVSAPSPVMAPAGQATRFYVHGLTPDPDGSVRLLMPQRIDLEADEYTSLGSAQPLDGGRAGSSSGTA